MDGLKVGNEALKKANEMFSIEEIEQIMEDTAEAIEKQQEIDALLSGQLSSEDENEVLEELDQLCNLEAEEENVTAQQLPDVPTEGEESTLGLNPTFYPEIPVILVSQKCQICER